MQRSKCTKCTTLSLILILPILRGWEVLKYSTCCVDRQCKDNNDCAFLTIQASCKAVATISFYYFKLHNVYAHVLYAYKSTCMCHNGGSV